MHLKYVFKFALLSPLLISILCSPNSNGSDSYNNEPCTVSPNFSVTFIKSSSIPHSEYTPFFP